MTVHTIFSTVHCARRGLGLAFVLLVAHGYGWSQTFAPTGSMIEGRSSHTATLLASGKVFVVGGANGGVVLASAELYNPTTGTFSTTGAMATVRTGHTATLMQNGKVLVTGGATSLAENAEVATAEVFDPSTGTFTATGSMAGARQNHTATLLGSGLVLIAGGCHPCGTGALSSAELYDPVAGTFSSTANDLITGRNAHTATLLTNGKVLIAGGYSGASVLASADLYDPTTAIFTATGSMTQARWVHAASMLPNGSVLIAGGSTTLAGGASADAELYNPAAGSFSATGSIATARWSNTSTTLTNGRALIAGGTSGSQLLATAELYDPAQGSFGAAGSMTAARHQHTATRLLNGNVLLAGGYGGGMGSLSSADIYGPVPAIPAQGLVSLLTLGLLMIGVGTWFLRRTSSLIV